MRAFARGPPSRDLLPFVCEVCGESLEYLALRQEPSRAGRQAAIVSRTMAQTA
jgi:hypothetical protein